MSDQRYLPEVLYENGFTDLISVVPPGASISPGSKLSPKMLGKVPGRKNKNGTWGGYPWLTSEHSVDDVREWMTWGANVGLRSKNFPGLDIDSMSKEIGDHIERLAHKSLGWAPVRFGQRPKRLMMYQTSEPFGRLRVYGVKGTPGKDDYEKHLVEFLGDGQQYLIYGVHPTGASYEWTEDMREVLPDSLTPVTQAQAEAFREEVASYLRTLGLEVAFEGDGNAPSKTAVDQQNLRAPSLEAVYEAMEHMENGEEFAGRKEWLDMAYALKGALGDEYAHEAQEMFIEWSMKWEGDAIHPGGNTEEVVEAEYLRTTGAPLIGWPWLAEKARGYGYSNAGDDFEALDAAPDEIPEPPEEDPRAPRYSDMWLAEAVFKEHGDSIRYAPESGWYKWNGKMWEPDPKAGKVLRAIHDTLKEIARNRLQQGDAQAAKEAKAIASQPATARVETLLRHAPGVAISVKSFDANPWDLNTPEGIVDLHTGKLRAPDPAALCSKSTSVAPDFGGPCPEFKRFLAEAMKDVAMESYLQRYMGYCLTGVTFEQQFSIWHGQGGNGKGTLNLVIENILGEGYAGKADISTFTEAGSQQHPTSIAKLNGARFVTASEANNRQKLDGAKLKAFSGEDKVSAHFMRENDFTFTPQCKILLLMNPMPTLRDNTKAMKRRLHLVPFVEEPVVVDQLLGEKLKTEYPAILAWMIEGCLVWGQQTLDPPDKVLEYTSDYFESEDHLGRWLRERVETSDNREDYLRVEDLFHDYNEWAGPAGVQPFKMSHTFARELKTKPLDFRKNAKMQSVVRGKKFRPKSYDPSILEALP